MNRLRREDRWERLGRNSTGAPAVAAIRRLSAIMAADVAGYSRLMEADEEGTHLRVKAHLRELIDANVGAHRGRIVKNTGDGILAEFPSVIDAFRCAVHMQRAMISREAGRIAIPDVDPKTWRSRGRKRKRTQPALASAIVTPAPMKKRRPMTDDQEQRSAIVEPKRKPKNMLAHLIEDYDPEAHRRPGEKADELFREIMRRAARKE